MPPAAAMLKTSETDVFKVAPPTTTRTGNTFISIIKAKQTIFKKKQKKKTKQKQKTENDARASWYLLPSCIRIDHSGKVIMTVLLNK
jgi:hypothetical protein